MWYLLYSRVKKDTVRVKCLAQEQGRDKGLSLGFEEKTGLSVRRYARPAPKIAAISRYHHLDRIFCIIMCDRGITTSFIRR